MLDSLVGSEDNFQELASIIGRVGELVEELGDLASRTTPELQKAGEQRDPRRARSLLRSLGTEFQKPGDELRILNTKFRKSLLEAGDALEVVVKHILDTGQVNEPHVREFLTAIISLESKFREGKDSIVNLGLTIGDIPRMERTFDKSRRKIVRELSQFADNIDQFISMILRIRTITGDS